MMMHLQPRLTDNMFMVCLIKNVVSQVAYFPSGKDKVLFLDLL